MIFEHLNLIVVLDRCKFCPSYDSKDLVV